MGSMWLQTGNAKQLEMKVSITKIKICLDFSLVTDTKS
jgi:hypothetical protein